MGHYEFITEIAALSGDALRTRLADMMGESVVVGNVPRDVLMKRLATVPDEELRALLMRAKDTLRAVDDDAKARGVEIVGVAYDAEELERIQAEQRQLKE
jgi:hypothetical protein